MKKLALSLVEDYWDNFNVENKDIEFLYNHLLEIETPLSNADLVKSLIIERIKQEKADFEKIQKQKGLTYRPIEKYSIGAQVVFPTFNWMKGEVIQVRDGFNPDVSSFKVITVKFENGEIKNFASEFVDHPLNQPITFDKNDKAFNPDYVLQQYGEKIKSTLLEAFKAKKDLLCLANYWFPRALLVDINAGHLNLAEAILDMSGGGPLNASVILEQIGFTADDNPALVEFSLNAAMYEDERFDEVGPSGEIIWYLKKLEPVEVLQKPRFLNYSSNEGNLEYYRDAIKMFDKQLIDELDIESDNDPESELSLFLIYPHWRSGTLPLTRKMKGIFPDALETSRIRFTFIDKASQKPFAGWVNRPNNYIFGLSDWYQSQGIIPGSIIHLKKGKNSGEVLVETTKRQSNRDWIRTIQTAASGTISITLQKQLVSTKINERMALYIANPSEFDKVWDQNNKNRIPLNDLVLSMFKEIVKLNPQGNVHFEEIYASVNLIRRFPIAPILTVLFEAPWVQHMGDLYFRLKESV